MRSALRTGLAALVVTLIGLAPAVSQAQSRPEFVTFRGISAAVYRPDSGPAPHVAFIYMNGGSRAMSQLACSALAKRGFMVLCSSSSFESDPPQGAWERVALDVKAGVQFLRGQPGITRVVLFGHSGGGAVASFYQAVAENGPDFCKQPSKLSRCGDDLAGLPPADAVVFPDAHPGLGVMDLRMINPAVSFTPGGGLKTDPSLDPFSPGNGFNPSGSSHYSAAFQTRYFAAQAKVGDALIERALAARARIAAGRLTDPRDALVMVPSWGFGAHLDMMDPTIPGLMTTQKPRKVLKNDGSVVVEIAHSMSRPEPDTRRMAMGVQGLHVTGIGAFLSRGSVRAKDSLDDIDYCSSNSATVCNVQSIRVPSLFAAMGASTFIGDDERMYERSAAADKDYIVIEGAVHGFVACKACETTPGQYANSADNLFDYIRDWVNKRL